MKNFNETDREYSEQELDEILHCLELDCYQIDMPEKEQIENCVQNLYQYLPRKKTFSDKLGFIFNEVKLELSYFNKFELKHLLTITIMFIALVVVSDNKPEIMFLSLAAVPIVTGFISLNKSKLSNMLELELSLKRSWKNRLFSKLFINYSVALTILLIMSIWVVGSGAEIDIVKYLSISLFVLGVLSVMSLWILFYSRGLLGSVITMVLWLVFSGGPLFSTRYFQLLESVSTINYILGAVLTTGLFIQYIIKMTKRDYDISVQLSS
ncbi:hypothetical protein HYG86_01445 [Alkalicella caledoniensis]|uniref:Uncharacterized protein n=1 Tax=Alkalicella caledoniensis TaxID=2731377 RepID=A0A7G9W4B2_ALKCA|nr:hypothetical protein [Alkalicella caledoniensis]QNO13524.1 hypothetical protein HYG86_01445 [Alkalicella caledoniensis]